MSSNKIGLQAESLEVSGKPIQYTMTLEPHNRLWMLMLDMPTLIPNGTKRTHDYSVVSEKPVRSRIRYDGASYSRYQLGVNLGERERLLSLQINEGENPKTVQLAKSWQGLSAEDKSIAPCNATASNLLCIP
jgi:hypothetical protein